jgi:hypothetical protein
MPRHDYLPNGVIPAILLPFDDDLAIDERAFRSHIRDVAATEGLSALTINAHSTEVASCSFDEQRRVLEIAQDEIGARLPIINGIWADGSLEAARIARMAAEGGASALGIRVNGEVLSSQPLRGGWQRYTWPLPAAVSQALGRVSAEISLIVDGPPSSRGLAVSAIRFSDAP